MSWKMPTTYLIILAIVAFAVCIGLLICIIRKLCRRYCRRNQRRNEPTVPLNTLIFTRGETETGALPLAGDDSVQFGDAQNRNTFYLIGTYSVPAQAPSIASTRPGEPPLTVPEAARYNASTHHPPLAQVPSIASTRPNEPPLRVPEAARYKASTPHSPLAPPAT